MIDQLLKESEKKMHAAVHHLQLNLGNVRTGRASLTLVENLKVNYYGTPTPLNQAATLGVPDSHTITIQPWDASIIGDIEKVIQTSDLGLNPANDGKSIRLNIPPLTGERRQQLVKVVKKCAEEGRVAIRNIRREFNDKIKRLEKDHEISEDQSRKGHTDIQKLTDQQIAEVDKIAQAKEKDVLED